MTAKTRKKLKISLLLLMTMTSINIRKCYAGYQVSFGTLGENSATSDIPYKDWAEIKKGKQKHEYTYKELVASNTGIVFDGYNSEGKSVMQASNVATESFKAGTWIGLNITEIQSASWVVSGFKYRETKKKYTCTYEKPAYTYTCTQTAHTNKSSCSGNFSPYYPGFHLGTCTYEKTCTSPADSKTKNYDGVDYYEEFTCPPTHPDNGNYKYVGVTSEDVPLGETTTSVISSEAEKVAISAAQTKASRLVGASIGIVNYIKDNKHPGAVDKLSYDTIKATKIGDRETKGWGTKQGSITQKYEYRQEKVCINVKTSEVSYGESCKELEGQIKIKNGTHSNGKTYWHYFIPLNTKTSNDNFFIQILANPDRKLSLAECKSAMEKYRNNYKDYIIPNLNGDTFIGDYPSNRRNSDLGKVEENNGCYFATTIYIPITQKFYKETENKNLKGFNFYYKPIDVNNPFPNGIPNTSIWKDWETTETPKLTGTSLDIDDITYIANVKDSKVIREYANKTTNNKKNSYTSWENMYVDGSSSFIKEYENEIFTKISDGFYKLGCGPANENKTNSDGTTNYLYQEECGT